MVTTTKFTRADCLALPEGFPAQLVEGELVRSASPDYGHQRLVLNLAVRLRDLVGPERVEISPIDVIIDKAMRQADSPLPDRRNNCRRSPSSR